ncbi:MAG: AAC(3) family N-acetyltransferase [Erysipelothrix sp.]|nr:AAC(3) family N-acetyltransferase [Erysipelothrix sp.]
MRDQILAKSELHAQFQKLGIKPGDIVYIETAVSPFKLSPDAMINFIHSLKAYLKSEGTIVANLNAPINYEAINTEMTAMNPSSLATFATNRIAAYLTTFKDHSVSASWDYPYVAIGKYAPVITNAQSADFPNGSHSPLARLYELHAKVILIDHEIKNLLINEHVIERSPQTILTLHSTLVDKEIQTVLNKETTMDIFDIMFKEKKYKQLFQLAKYNELPILSMQYRDYVDYCNQLFEREV